MYEWLKSQKEQVYFHSGEMSDEQILFLTPALVISYNYSFLIPENIISLVEDKIINLHISYLPWNKGSDPNFWSFIENTPKGVTIHRLSAELDQGAIILQKEIVFNEKAETFRSSYKKLNKTIVSLFQSCYWDIKEGKIISSTQVEGGSYHRKSDFVDFIKGKVIDWDETIEDFKQRYGCYIDKKE